MIFLDYETSSEADIKKVGGYRYNNDPSTRILMFAVARDDQEVFMWRFDEPDSEESRHALHLFDQAIFTGEEIHGHNVSFELAVTRYRAIPDLGLTRLPALEQWRCTMALCQKAALPQSLGAAAEFLRLDQAKDKRGSALIQLFSVRTKEDTLQAPADVKVYDKSDKGRRAPNRKSYSPIHGWHETVDGVEVHHDKILWDWLVTVGGELMTVRDAWELFIEYCRQDVRTEREIHRKLHKFELTGKSLASFQFNLRMNDRGVPVNITALKNAYKLILQYQKRANLRFKNLTGLTPTQGQKFKVWLQERGYFRDDLQAITVEDFMTDFSDLLTPDAHAALSMFQLLNFAALAKVPAMLNAACDDGFVRGTMLWHGARTGRATGRLIQPQNMKKATLDTKVAYRMICEGCTLEDMEELWDSPLEVIASCARHFIQLPGTEFYDADFVGVEARITPWVVGDVTTLQSILDGEDQYKRQASAIFNVPYEEVTKAQRTIAKPVSLGCCFGVGGQGLQNGLAGPPYNTKVPLKECKRIVKVYRDTHPETVEAWKAIEDAVKGAIKDGTTSTIMEGRVKVGRVTTAGVRFFVIQLPSGRRLHYPSPSVKSKWVPYDEKEMLEDPWKFARKGYTREEITFYGSRPNNAGWGWVSTHSSKLFENIVQSIGADLLDEGCISASEAGFDIFLLVHDQALCYQHPEKALQEFTEAFCSVGSWADTFPLEADGNVVPYYLKD